MNRDSDVNAYHFSSISSDKDIEIVPISANDDEIRLSYVNDVSDVEGSHPVIWKTTCN